MKAVEGLKYGLIGAGVLVAAYVGYKTYQAVKGVVSVAQNIGTGKNVQAVWDARPKIIFKGLENEDFNLLSGMI